MFDLGNLLQQNVMDPMENAKQQILASPRGRQALIQAGLNLLQPVGFGQSGLGHIAGAIGSAMEARDRGVKADMEAEDLARRRAIEAENQALKKEEVGLRREDLGLRREDQRRSYGLNERRVRVDESRAQSDEIRAKAALERAKNPRLSGGRSAADYLQQDMLKEIARVEADAVMTPDEKIVAQKRIRDAYMKVIQGAAATAPSTSGEDLTPQDWARQAIEQGADPAAVRQRLLEQYGIDLEP